MRATLALNGLTNFDTRLNQIPGSYYIVHENWPWDQLLGVDFLENVSPDKNSRPVEWAEISTWDY